MAVLGLLGLIGALLAGLRAAWRDWRGHPLRVLLALAALAYLGTLPLRLVQAAWESALRAGDFLFVGVGLTAAAGIALVAAWLGPRRGLANAAAAGAITLAVASGVVAGWPTSLRLARPLRVAAGSATLEPPAFAAARWTRQMLGAGNGVAAQGADARVFEDVGGQRAFAGSQPDVQDILDATSLASWQGLLLRAQDIDLAVSDRVLLSDDVIGGYFFTDTPQARLAIQTETKFDAPDVDRIYDAGDITIFYVKGLW